MIDEDSPKDNYISGGKITYMKEGDLEPRELYYFSHDVSKKHLENSPGFMKYLILQDLFGIVEEHSTNFGELIICLDKSSSGYWRKDVYPGYKAKRKTGRDESEVNYGEVFAAVEGLTEQMKINLPWKVIEIDGHDMKEIIRSLQKMSRLKGPKMIIANTIAGKDVASIEGDHEWYGKRL